MLKKIKRVLCVVFLFLSFSGFAEKGRLSFSPEEKTYDSLAPLGIRKLSGTAAGKTQSLNFSLSTGQLKWQTVNRRDLVTAEGFDFVTPAGSPMVPAKIFAFNLPQDAVVTGVDVANVRYREILNSLDIAPAPNPVRITPPERIRSDVQLTIPLETTEQEQGNFYGKDEAVYSLESFYPGELVQWETGKDNERTAVYVRLFPVQYNPSQKTSFVVTSATITVYYESSSGTAVTGMSTTMGTTDYELLIITPFKYRDLARKLQEMHRNDPFSPLYTCYVYLEDIENYYFRPGAPYLQPDPGNPPYDPHPQNVYPDMGRTTARKIIRFLGDMAKQYQYAPYGILHPVPAVRDEVKFQYVLILGRGDAVPPSWYPYYPQYTDLGWLATDFFYASPSAPSAGISYDLLPEFSVGRIPVVEEPVVKTVYTVNAIHYGNLTITTNTSLPVGVKTGDLIMMMSGTARSLFFEITQITDNSPDSFTLTVKETDPGPEAPESYFSFVAEGNTYQFHINVLNNLYTKQQKWLNEISTTGAWTNWFRNIAVAGGPSFGTSFYWHELAANQYINNGHLEHNRILKKLFRTGKEDSDFDPDSIEPFLNNTVDTGLFYIGCHGSGAAFAVDNDTEPPYNPSGASPAYITSELIKNYSSPDSRLPIIVSPSCLNAIFDPNIYFSIADRSLGEAVVNAFDETTKEGGTGIAYIGWSREGYATVDAYFDKG